MLMPFKKQTHDKERHITRHLRAERIAKALRVDLRRELAEARA